MGVVKKLANVLKYEQGANYGLGRSMSSSSVSNLFGTGGSDINVLEEYSGYVWKCVNVRSEDLASQELFVERLVGDKWQRDNKHDFNMVLEGVDGGYDLSELLEAHQVCMDMYGESFWYFSKGETHGKPFAVYLLDPAYVTVLVSGERVTGYIYQKDGDYIAMDLDEIAHFRIHNPSNRFRGAGPMQKAGWFIRSSRYVTTYINNFLENNAIPAGVIVSKDNVNDADWKLFKEQWTAKYSGIDNAGKTGFVRGDLDFVKTGLSLGEVDFDKVKNSSRDDILAMFSMPKSKLGLYEDFNKASAVISDQQFAKSFTAPAIRRITRRLSRKVGVWYGQQYQVGTDFVIPEDDEQKLNEYAKLTNVAFTVNETREAYGKPGLGKEFDTIPLGQLAPTDNNPPVKTYVQPEQKKLTVKIKTVTKSELTTVKKEEFRSETEAIQLKYEAKFLEASNKVLTDQRDRVIDQLQPKKIVDSNLDAQQEATMLADEVLAIELALAIEQGQLAASFAGNAETKFELTPVMEKYIKDSIAKSALSFTNDTLDLVSKAVADGLANGDSVKTIADSIKSIYKDATGVKTPGYRIERLARTEIIKTSNEISEAAYMQTGVVTKKEWFANPGACEFCMALNGSIIQLGGTFVPLNGKLEGTDGGTRLNTYEAINHPPQHSSCRCTLIPVVAS